MQLMGMIWAGLYVEDLEKSVAFYRDVLGLTLTRQGEGWANFNIVKGQRFELLAGGKASSEAKGADRQSIVPGFQVDDLEQAMQSLSAKGMRFIGEIGEYRGSRWVEFLDPEGNRLEIKEIRTAFKRGGDEDP